jgi:UDP-glucose 4-epimerase
MLLAPSPRDHETTNDNKMITAWVVGRSGLLGSALVRALSRNNTPMFDPDYRFLWGDGVVLEKQIESATASFLEQIAPGESWQIFWAAGIGSMGSSEADFSSETRALECLLRHLNSHPLIQNTSGAIVLASSAGAIYAGCTESLITEESIARPTTPYAREKINHEEMLRAFCTDKPTMSALVARISTLYGAGQNSEKPQGLLSHISRKILRNQPVHIYVPFDTIRDYILVDDAAIYIINSLKSVTKSKKFVTKIIASEKPTTIAEIIYIFKRLARKSPRTVTVARQTSSVYSRRIQFKSVVHPLSDKPLMTSLPTGISRLMSHELRSYAANPISKSA